MQKTFELTGEICGILQAWKNIKPVKYNISQIAVPDYRAWANV